MECGVSSPQDQKIDSSLIRSGLRFYNVFCLLFQFYLKPHIRLTIGILLIKLQYICMSSFMKIYHYTACES